MGFTDAPNCILPCINALMCGPVVRIAAHLLDTLDFSFTGSKPFQRKMCILHACLESQIDKASQSLFTRARVLLNCLF